MASPPPSLSLTLGNEAANQKDSSCKSRLAHLSAPLLPPDRDPAPPGGGARRTAPPLPLERHPLYALLLRYAALVINKCATAVQGVVNALRPHLAGFPGDATFVSCEPRVPAPLKEVGACSSVGSTMIMADTDEERRQRADWTLRALCGRGAAEIGCAEVATARCLSGQATSGSHAQECDDRE